MLFVTLSPKSKYSSKLGSAIRCCLVPILLLLNVLSNNELKKKFSLGEQKSQGCLFKSEQNFAVAKREFGQHMYRGPLQLHLFIKRVIYEVRSHFNQIRIVGSMFFFDS